MFGQTRRISCKLINNFVSIKSINKRNSGHSKWANIRHIKALKDGQKSLMYTKLGRQIRVAVQEGGSIDPKKNVKLEQIVAQAKRMSMPAATLESILKSTQTDKNQCKSYMLEIKGPGSCIILCEVFTDRLHVCRQSVQTILKKLSSKFADGSGGMYFFNQKGIIIAEPPQMDKSSDLLEIAMEHAIETGAEDVSILEEGVEFLCSVGAFNNVLVGLTELKYTILSASLEYIPNKYQTLSESELETYDKLVKKLDDLPEVVKLYDNVG